MIGLFHITSHIFTDIFPSAVSASAGSALILLVGNVKIMDFHLISKSHKKLKKNRFGHWLALFHMQNTTKITMNNNIINILHSTDDVVKENSII